MRTLITIGIVLIQNIFSLSSCSGQDKQQSQSELKTGAEQTEKYLHLLRNKRVAVVANQTSMIGNISLIDSLLALNVNIVRIFGPEHCFRGTASAGAHVADRVDAKTKIREK